MSTRNASLTSVSTSKSNSEIMDVVNKNFEKLAELQYKCKIKTKQKNDDGQEIEKKNVRRCYHCRGKNRSGT